MEIWEVDYEKTLNELKYLTIEGLKKERAITKGKKARLKYFLNSTIVAIISILGIVKPEWFEAMGLGYWAKFVIIIITIIIIIVVTLTIRAIEKLEQKLDIIEGRLKTNNYQYCIENDINNKTYIINLREIDCK